MTPAHVLVDAFSKGRTCCCQPGGLVRDCSAPGGQRTGSAGTTGTRASPDRTPKPRRVRAPQRALSRTPSSRRRQPRSLARPTWRRCSHPRSGQHPKQESTARVESGGPPKGGGSSGTSAPQSHLISCKSLAQEATTIAPWLVPQAPSHVWLWGYAPGTGDDDSQAVAQSRWDDQRPGSGGTRHMQPREGSTGHRGEAHRVAQQGDGTIPLVLPEPPLFGEGSASHLTPSRVEGQDRMRTEPAVPRG